MPAAQVALATITLGSSASSVTFGSIPATYRDLRLVINGQVVTSGVSIRTRLNGDSGSNYSYVYAGDNPTNTGSSGAFTDTSFITGYIGTASTALINAIDIMDYSATDKHKTALGRNSTPQTYGAEMSAGRWANTAAVTSVASSLTSGNWAAGTTLSLYGIVS